MKIGKTSVDITIEGCVNCGTRWSSGWKVDRSIPAKIGKREFTIELSICADCLKAREQETRQLELVLE